jgi:hypothetical protein
MKKILILVFLSAILSSCQRSMGYKRDKDYYGEDPSSYYDQAQDGQSAEKPSQRIARLGQPKKRVFVFDFWNDSPLKEMPIEAYSADELRRALFLSKRVIIAPELKSELKTADFVQGDKVKVAQLIRESRKLGVAVAVIGRIARIVFRQKGEDIGILRQRSSAAAVDLEVKLFDVATGREIAAIGRSGEAQASALALLDSTDLSNLEYRIELVRLAIRNTIQPLVSEILKNIDKMSWEGRVVKVLGSRVYINAGKASGLVQGDILKVLTPGQDIFDPATGVLLGRAQGIPKGTVEVVDFLGTDGAVAEVHTGGNFQEGDLVHLY